MNINIANIRTITVMFLDIFIMWLVLYYALRIIRNNTRTIQIFKGILFVILVDLLAQFLGLKTVKYFADIFVNWGFLAVIIVFQPEIRSLLEKMGKSNVFSRITTLTGNEREKLVDEIVTAVMLLSDDQTGALISIEQAHSLEDYIATGTRLNSDVTAELLTSIFVTSTPLHDGAVIIQGDKIACASAYFPPTNLDLPSRFGARHRAAIGISEITDAVTIVVSEETGGVSIAENGKIFAVNRQQLHDYLLRVICGEVTEIHSTHRSDEAIIPADQELIIARPDKEEEISRTGMLDKLAIKKQNTAQIEKVEVEAVKPAKNTKPSQPSASNPPKKKFSLFKQKSKANLKDKQEEKMKELDEEAASIKLPHKKKMATPSYPKQKPVENRPEPPKRMSSEEVEALRQESYRRMKVEETGEIRTPIVDAEQYEKDAHLYDTTRLDISKIVGFNDELDDTFKMVDETTSQKENGGDNA